MIGAKIFAIGAVAIALTAALPVQPWGMMTDVYMHDTYFVVAPRFMTLLFALLYAVFASFYYFGDRATLGRLSSSLSVCHFLFWIFALVAFSVEERLLVRTVMAGQDPTKSWLITSGSAAAVLALVAGGLLFLTNLIWAVTRRPRTT